MHAEAIESKEAAFGPWNPGIASELPASLLPLSTIFRPDHVFTSVAHARDLEELTGLPLEELVVFRPQRLLLHELLVRITADYSVPDGYKVEDLGINFRRMTDTILKRHLAPRMDEIVARYDDVCAQLKAQIEGALATMDDALERDEPVAPKPGGLRRLFDAMRKPARRSEPIEDDWAREERVLEAWSERARASPDALKRAAYRALVRVASAVRSRHGRMWGDRAMLADAAAGLAANDHGADVLGAMIDPLIIAGAEAEGFHRLPLQAKPVVMNTKGASASGKSTMRPLQKRLAAEIGVDWADFALISPDIWRKYLLDYNALGEHYKYAGSFTGKELAIIDQKLDRYMASKGERGEMSHLLIDRFRFDSFAPDSEEAGSNLLTRFGHLIYMFFMITPPHETVERSWRRGLDVGRFKAVDDLLAHNVEAYTGMPRLFFTWALRPNKAVHYEFLDNSVAYGKRPRTIAFGWNGEMNVLDVRAMLNIDRYRKIDIDATQPADVYADRDAMAASENCTFLVECARQLPTITFAEPETGRIYARLERGQLAWIDHEALARALEDDETRTALSALAPSIASMSEHSAHPPVYLQPERFQTLGHWGARESVRENVSIAARP